ncbi:TPA: glutaredoxin [Candidatus Galligastranaerophilus gallistercoris]|nr:glutaredoxin [Candidatus Galligastranaerophilus gallistercoris]
MSIEIYTLSYCPYCAAAKRFFDERGMKYTEYQLDGNEDEEFRKLQKKFNIQNEVTVPQIIVNGKRIGGYTDMMTLLEEGKLKF